MRLVRVESETIFLLGMNASGTTAMMNIVNAHPAAFVLPEIEFTKSFDATSRNAEFAAAMPEARVLFQRNDHREIFNELSAMLRARGHEYRAVGTKLLWRSVAQLEQINPFRCVFNVRDLRTWVAKNANIISFFPENYPGWVSNVVPPVVDYVKCYINSFRLERCLRIRLEDFIADSNSVVTSVAEHLGLSDHAVLMKSWHVLPLPQLPDPKAMVSWQAVHESAQLPAVVHDTEVKLAEHPVWRGLMPIFAKYYAGADNRFSLAEIEADLADLDRIRATHKAVLYDLYVSYRSKTLTGVAPHGEGTVAVAARAAVSGGWAKRAYGEKESSE